MPRATAHPAAPAQPAEGVEIIHPPNALRIKLGRGRFDPNVLARAEAAVAQLSEGYVERLLAEIGKLGEAAGAVAQAAAGEERKQRLTALYLLSHDIKGQGATFNYPLVTRIAHSLCRYIDRDHESAPIRLDIVAMHVESLRSIAAARASGDGGTLGKEIARHIEAAVAARG